MKKENCDEISVVMETIIAQSKVVKPISQFS